MGVQPILFLELEIVDENIGTPLFIGQLAQFRDPRVPADNRAELSLPLTTFRSTLADHHWIHTAKGSRELVLEFTCFEMTFSPPSILHPAPLPGNRKQF